MNGRAWLSHLMHAPDRARKIYKRGACGAVQMSTINSTDAYKSTVHYRRVKGSQNHIFWKLWNSNDYGCKDGHPFP